jgi:vacuolar-type H+-ATPase subunit H
MTPEAIKIISEAEDNSKRAKAEAAQTAKRMLAEAEEAGRRAVEDAKRKAEEELAELKRQALEKARGEALALARNTENRKAAMLVRAEMKKEQAIGLVVERIVRS